MNAFRSATDVEGEAREVAAAHAGSRASCARKASAR